MEHLILKPKKGNEEVCKALHLIKNTKEQYRSKDLIFYLVGKENNLLRSHNVKENSLFTVCGKENSSIFEFFNKTHVSSWFDFKKY